MKKRKLIYGKSKCPDCLVYFIQGFKGNAVELPMKCNSCGNDFSDWVWEEQESTYDEKKDTNKSVPSDNSKASNGAIRYLVRKKEDAEESN